MSAFKLDVTTESNVDLKIIRDWNVRVLTNFGDGSHLNTAKASEALAILSNTEKLVKNCNDEIMRRILINRRRRKYYGHY